LFKDIFMMEIRIYQIDVPTSTNTKVEDDETQKKFSAKILTLFAFIFYYFFQFWN